MAEMPEQIGRYQVREVIGTGGFATVYRATDERFGVDVAVKVLADSRSFDPDVRERFLDEARRLRRLHSPQLIAVHDVGETERGQPYMVLEWADRGDLAARVVQRREAAWLPTTGDARAVAQAVAAALSVLHRHDIVHRDVAPKNLLLRSTMSPRALPVVDGDEVPVPTIPSVSGAAADPVVLPTPADVGGAAPLVASGEELVLADLGVSKDLAEASGLTLAAGTSGFAPPEQREPGLRVDRRADVWAASALLVWLGTDRAPDSAGRWQTDLQATGWPSGVASVLAGGLAEEPDDRYSTIDEWLTAVDGALQPSAAAGDARHEDVPGTSGPQHVRRRAWLAVPLGGALLVGAATGVAATRDRSSGPDVRTETLDGGELRTVAESDDGIVVRLDGPTEARVGEEIVLSGTVEGTDHWTWVGPDGAVVPGQETLTLAPQTAGRGTVRLLAFDGREIVEATHRLDISNDS